MLHIFTWTIILYHLMTKVALVSSHLICLPILYVFITNERELNGMVFGWPAAV